MSVPGAHVEKTSHKAVSKIRTGSFPAPAPRSSKAQGAVPHPHNLLNGAQWPPRPGPRGPGGHPCPTSRDGEKFPRPHPCCCLDTGPQCRGLGPVLPNPSHPAELSPAPGMQQVLVWTPNASFSFLAARHPLGWTRPRWRGGQEGLGLTLPSRPSSTPRPSQSPFLPLMEGGASPQAYPLPQREAHLPPCSSAPQGRNRGTPAWGVAPQSFQVERWGPGEEQ